MTKTVLLNNLYIQGFDPQQQRPSPSSQKQSVRSYVWTDQVFRGGDTVARGRLRSCRQQGNESYRFLIFLMLCLIVVGFTTILVVSYR